MLGQRLGEMHQPRPSTAKDSQAWAHHIGEQLNRALDLLAEHRDGLERDSQALVDDL